MKRFTHLQQAVNFGFVVVAFVVIVMIIAETSWRHLNYEDAMPLLLTPALFVLLVIGSTRLNFITVSSANPLFTERHRRLKRQRHFRLFAIIFSALLITLLMVNLPYVYIFQDCSRQPTIDLPASLYIFDPWLPPDVSVPYHVDLPHLLTVAFWIGVVASYFTLSLSNFGYSKVRNVSAKSGLCYCQMLLGFLCIAISVFIFMNTYTSLQGFFLALIEYGEIIITLDMFDFIVALLQSMLIFLYGIWIAKEAKVLNAELFISPKALP